MSDFNIKLDWNQPFDTVSWFSGDYLIKKINIGDRVGYKALKGSAIVYSFEPDLEVIKTICNAHFKRCINTYPKTLPGYARVMFVKDNNMVTGIVKVMFPEGSITYQNGNKYQADKFIITEYIAAWCPKNVEQYQMYSRIVALSPSRTEWYPNGQYHLGEVYVNGSFLPNLTYPRMDDSEIIIYPSIHEVIENC